MVEAHEPFRGAFPPSAQIEVSGPFPSLLGGTVGKLNVTT